MNTELAVAQHPTFPIVAQQLEQRLPSIQAFLGGNALAADRFRRVVLQSLVRNPDLLQCTPDSLVSAAAEAAQLGLEPSGAVGGAHIVRFKDRAQLLIDYRGLVELARRSNEIEDVWADVVREKDHFVARRGLRPDLEHEPDYTAGRAPSPDTEGNRVIHVYAVAAFRSGHRRFDVMSRAEVDAIRARSRAANAGPWVTDWSEMAKKTVMRRLCKTLPLTAQAKEVIAADEAREYGDHHITVEKPSEPTGSLVERLRARRAPLGATEHPEQESAQGDAAPAVAARARESQPGQHRTSESATAAASATQPGDDGSPSVASTTPPAQTQPDPGPVSDAGASGEENGASADGQAAASPAASPTKKPVSRKRTAAAAPKQPGDEGYGTARAHAVADERGMDHAAVHRLAADVLRIAEEDLAAFSVSTLIEADWDQVIASIAEAPVNDAEVEDWAGRMALQAGMGSGDNPWPVAEPAAMEMFGVATANDLTPAQWREFGIRTYARNPLP